jgi:DMSO/TMAO reductase YedYZ molybdopterin-dependent catalytic subunit
VSGRTTNLALAVLFAVALLSGAAAFATGTAAVRWPTLVHAAAGLGMLVLVPWKHLVVRRGWKRHPGERWASVLLAVLVLLAVISGLLFSTGLVLRYGPLNAMQVHVGSALLALPLFAAHWWRRPVRPRTVDLGRRNALRAGAVLGAAAGLVAATEGVTRVAGLPGAERRASGSYERASFRPQAMPATQWLDDRVQHLDPAEWRLAVRWADGERSWTFDEVDGFGDAMTATLDCTSGWFSTQRWRGARLDRVLAGADGSSFVVVSATGYRRRFPRHAAADLLLATRLGDAPLSAGHGSPARLVAPDRRGFWWVKWITEIALDDRYAPGTRRFP